MRRRTIGLAAVLVAAAGLYEGAQINSAQPEMAAPQGHAATTEGDFVVKDFKFRDGEALAELRLHYAALGSPRRDSAGHLSNAVMLLHGTGGSGAKFLEYDYDDMVAAHHALLEHLGVEHLRLILGTSMGCMHSFVWGETYPEFMDALMPLACQPVQVAGRNRVWRKMVMDAIRNDPEWKGGEYTAEPKQGLRTALDLLLIAGSAPLQMQRNYPTRDAADKYLDEYFAARMPGLDANDLLYQVNASRNYDPLPSLEKIRARVMYVNSADDFINPPELGIAQRDIKRMKGAKFVVIPISDATHGHGTHTWAAVWKEYLAELLAGK